MAVRVLTAPPGKGKTLGLTRKAIQLFNDQNNLIDKLKKDFVFYNSIYSNYPILLHHSKKKI